MRHTKNKKLFHISLALLLAVSSLLTVTFVQRAQAATMDEVFVRFDRMKISEPTTGTVCVIPATTSTDVKTWKVTFPTGYTLGAGSTFQNTNISTTDLAWPTTATVPSSSAWPNAASATAAVVGQTVTWTNASAQTMNSGTRYCFNWLNTTSTAVTVASSEGDSLQGSVSTQNSSAVDIDTGSYATAAITDDQIVVTATVPPAFTFALDGYTDALGTLSASSVASSTPPRTVTVDTNSKNGWAVWAKDSNTGLTSASAGYTIPAKTYSGLGPTTVTAGTEGYNTGVVLDSQAGGSGTVTIDPGFEPGGTGEGGGLSTILRSIATSDGSAATAILSLTNNVAINGATPAATDYTDTITVIGAGLF